MKSHKMTSRLPDVGSLWISGTGPVMYGEFSLNMAVTYAPWRNMFYSSYVIEKDVVIMILSRNDDALTVNVLVGEEKKTVVWKSFLRSSMLQRMCGLSDKRKKPALFFAIYKYETHIAKNVHQGKHIRQPIRIRQVRFYKRIQRCCRGT